MPPMTAADISNFQERVDKWSRYNFPNSLPHHPLLGLFEELGELAEATDTQEWDDAIGDLLVYLANYCGLNDISLEAAVFMYLPTPWDHNYTTRMDDIVNLTIVIGKLSHAHLKCSQGIRVTEPHIQNKIKAVGQLVYHVQRAIQRTDHRHWLEIAFPVWELVERRDWVKYPKNGLPE